MALWRTSGDVLRWWRDDVLGLTQQEAAERLNVRASALSNWERGKRAISLDLSEVDEALKGEHTLEGLLWAFSTPEGLEPGRLWTKVFPGPSRPVWLWLRSPVEHIAFEGEWGVTRLETELELGPNGLFVTVGASIADSPVVVQLSNPGWADFGTGELPPGIPGAPVVTAVSMFQRSTADGPFMEMFSSNLVSKLSSGSPEALDLADAVPDAVGSYVHGGQPAGEVGGGPGRDEAERVPKRWPPEAEGVDVVDRKRFARLRRARGLSLNTMADRLARETDIEVGRDTLRRFETSVGQPHDPMLPIALDHVLGAGGRLAVLELRSDHGTGTARLPPYWRGPIWIRLDDPRPESHVVLRRGNWHREVTFHESALLSTHWFEPSVPLRIIADASTAWSIGVGRRAKTQSADQNWVPATVEAAQQGLAETEQAIFTALKRQGKTQPPPS
ncbi:MAG: helix-turn-helix domain-containing protein [Acidimicrobiales bacterium]